MTEVWGERARDAGATLRELVGSDAVVAGFILKRGDLGLNVIALLFQLC